MKTTAFWNAIEFTKMSLLQKTRMKAKNLLFSGVAQ
jgi:hypothetical protein